MNNISALKDKSILIVGLGKSGLSIARYLNRKGLSFSVVDSREKPPGVEEIKRISPDCDVHQGFEVKLFCSNDVLIVSPGVSVNEPAIVAAKKSGALVVGDIELFAWEVAKPVVSVTGSNGKSTVVSMLGEMGEKVGLNVKVCGNFGDPALDFVDDHSIDLFILELSSFQLETTYSLHSSAACILNISEDHMDRYTDIKGYIDAKRKIYDDADCVVVNRGDKRAWPSQKLSAEKKVYFAADEPLQKDVFGLASVEANRCLMLGDTVLMRVDELKVPGEHNAINALAAIALGRAVNLEMQGMVDALKGFTGLPHRVEFVCEADGVKWYNDSKGTNVGATVKAVTGLDSPVILIAGGVGKGADFQPLADVAEQSIKAAVLIGRDADLIGAALGDRGVPVMFASTMDEAVKNASSLSISGDVVLLSPACASFDMFKSFEERGEIFIKEVMRAVA